MFGQDLRSGGVVSAALSLLFLSGLAFSQDSTYEDTTTFASSILTETNEYRVQDQATPATYNVSMANAAAQYVTQCIFEHPPLYEQGSNLAAGFANPQSVVDAWYNEITVPGYDFSTPGPQTGTLHFTQLVWNASTQIGCGAYFCNGTNNVPGWYTACYYYPEGNVVLYGNPGFYFEQNVFPPINNAAAESAAAAASTSSSTAASSTSLSAITSSAAASAATSISTSVLPNGSTLSAVAVVPTANPVASSSSTQSLQAVFSAINGTEAGTMTIPAALNGTTIHITTPTTFTTDGALIIINPPSATPTPTADGVNMEIDGTQTGVLAAGEPLPTCEGMEPVYVMLDGGLINMVMPDVTATINGSSFTTAPARFRRH